MKSTIRQVAEFHEAYGHPIHDEPHIIEPELNNLRVDLLSEELDELEIALCQRDKVGVLDALCDLQYVLDGAFLALGFAAVKDKAFAEVHRANMSKLGADGKPVRREDGKILKGPSYKPPNLEKYIE